MTQQEFLDILKRALNGQVPPYVVSENLNYYDTYISGQKQNGRSEADVLDELGDPRLLARTIIDAEGPSGQKKNRRRAPEYDEVYSSEETDEFRPQPSPVSKWVVLGILFLILFLVCILLFFTFRTAFTLLFSFRGIWFWVIILLIIYSLSRRR